ncbi:Multidrug resistance-associated protein 1 [Lucilia cuprina]|nr:Multidrug resistance-associated protein 1 [Lucilia cuprina]
MANNSHPMDEFCGSKFWDSNETWYTVDPDFTPCFEQTVLVWAPCAFLWLFSIFDFYYLKASLDKNIPWNKLNISKLLLTLSLLVLTAVDFIMAMVYKADNDTADLIYPVHIWTPVIKFATFILILIFIPLNRKYGIRTSGCQFLFWFFLTILSIARCRTEVRGEKHRADAIKADPNADFSWEEYEYTSFMIYFAFCCGMLVLNCFADAKPRLTKYERSDNEIPEVSASFLSRITYQWFDGMAWRGYRNPLEEKDLWDLNPQDSCKEVMPIFAYYWNKNVRKYFKSEPNQTKVQFSKDKVTFENPHGPKTGKKTGTVSIMPPIVKSFGGVFLFGSMMKLFTDILTFAQPQVLRLIIGFVEDSAEGSDTAKQPEWKGIFYAVLLFVLAATQTIILGQYFHRMFTVGLRIRTALINAIYRKALVISNATRKESTVGEIVNLMAVDAQRFMDLTTYLNMLWSAPLQIGLALFFLWQLLGPSVLAGLAVMIILIPVNGVIANRIKTYQIRQMKYKDERVKLMNEVLSGIKVLKLYAWEPSFEKQVLEIREKEIATLKSTAYLNASTSFLWSCAPFLVSLVTFATYVLSSDENHLTASKVFVGLTLFDAIKLPMITIPMLMVDIAEVSLVTFATYVLIDENNVLDATKTFVSLSLFNILRFPLTMLPMLISNMVQTQVSVQRINKFMNSEELDPNNVQHDPKKPNPLSIVNGSFSWGDDDVTLKNINIEVKKNTLCAIVGTVGSGKSSVIQAFLGEMEKISGSIAYVPQQAWIQNATLRENILFGKEYDRKRYNRVIDACALRADIDMLSAGDKTEIGEKGINLSGGQKQRISLARAVYSDADLYFLDDPLSAVDSHVGKHIFEEVVGPKGLLAKKTRILVTHGITFLPQTDNIYVMKMGEIVHSEDGTYQELLNKKGDFSDFLLQHIQEGNEEVEDLDVIKQQLEGTLQSDELKGKFEKVIKLARTESLSDSVSVRSFESGRSSLRRRRVDRQDSETSMISATSKTKLQIEEQGKLIETEKSRTGGVEFAVYKHYIKSVGIFLSMATLILNFVFQAFQIGSNLWLTKWSNDKLVSNDTGLRDMYLGVYGAFGFGQVIARYLSGLFLALGCLHSSMEVFVKLLSMVFKWPMELFDITPQGRIISLCNFGASLCLWMATLHASLELFTKLYSHLMHCSSEFFDITPKGRILDRCSNDINTIDLVIPMTIRMFISTAFQELLLNIFRLPQQFFDTTPLGPIFSYGVALVPWLGALRAALLLHNSLLTNIMRLPLSFFDTTPLGRILSRFSKDLESLDTVLPRLFDDALWCGFEVLATIVVISMTTPIFMAVIVPIAFLYYFAQRFYVATSRQLMRLESVSRSPIYSHFGETVTGVSTIRAYSVQDRFIDESDTKVDKNQVCKYPSLIANRWLAIRLEMVGNLIILFASLFAVLGGQKNAGLVGLSVSYALQVTQTLNWLVRMSSDIETNIVAVERIKEYGETKQEAPWELENSNVPKNWPLEGEVVFENFKVRYREGLDLVLRGISFKIAGGEKVGIVGRTGAGKSSLTLSLFRIIEAAGGRILIDGIDIATMGLHMLRSRLTIIPQDPVLFSGSLRINLDPFEVKSDAEIWKALELSHLKAFVKSLPAGLNHEISEGGDNLSVGQRQLVCLARALLRKTKVLVLDEATAAVDLETDDLIQKTIRSEFKECTVLTIAHRLNTILDSDKVIVLDKGEISEFDSPENLLNNSQSAFYSMAKDANLVILKNFLFFSLKSLIFYVALKKT